jgi:glycosyltransferase involved in cell wall biosynthesis
MKRIKNLVINPLKNKYNRIINKTSIDNIEKGKSTLIENIKSRKKSFIKYIIIFISFLFILILSYIIIKAINFKNKINSEDKVEYKLEEEDEDENYKPDIKSIYEKENFYYSYQESYNKAKEFIKNNINGLLINTEKVQLSQKPNVSVVIPCYNCSKYILRAIRSIQNQDFSNFEIIIANDGSKDDSLTILQQFQKEENRIRIINNKVNMGTLYTRSIATLSAKGRYIFPMDIDDMFLDQDVFSVITNIAYKGNFDIIIFNSVYTDLKPDVYTAEVGPTYFDRNHKPNLVLFQPDLGYYNIAPSENLEEMYLNDELLHGKLVKTKVYKKALNKLGKERYSRFMISGEDNLACNIIYNTAKTAKFIAKYGYLYVNNEESASRKQNNNIIVARGPLYVLDALIDFSLDLPKNKKVLVNYIIILFKNEYLKDVLSGNYDNKLFNSCLDRILNCKYISDELKNEIRIRGKNLKFIKYNF